MRAADLAIPAASFAQRHDSELTAVASVAVALIAAGLVDRAFARRGRTLAAAIGRGDFSPVADTRLRLVRRLCTASILALGVMVAISQFEALDRVAASLLASGALAAAVVGFAARQVLANAVAGVMLAITQPLRIGDSVSFEGEAGTVEDVRLNYTFLRTGDDRRVIIPNERLAGGVLRNDTIIDPRAGVEVEVWLAPDADADRAVERLTGIPGAAVTIAEITSDGVRLAVAAEPVDAAQRASRESLLRAECLRRLRDVRPAEEQRA
jgi:small-conductance mechanosensitive channel